MSRLQRRRGRRTTGAKPSAPSGRMTRSQSVSTFGVGAIFELRFSSNNEQVLNSVIIAGLDEWPEDACLPIDEPVLQRALGVSHFRLSPPAPDNNRSPDSSECIPAFRFPIWMVCSECQALGTAPRQFDDRRSSKPQCRSEGCSGRGIPARLVTSCFAKDPDGRNHPGHIDEFPWNLWAHKAGQKCEKPKLELRATGSSAGLSGLRVGCKVCGAGESLAGVFSEHALSHLTCQGKRPWLNDKEGCDRPIRALMRGASNIYFPIVASAITIPPYSEKLRSTLTRKYDVIKSLKHYPLDVLLGVVMNDPKLKKNYSKEQVMDALVQLRDADAAQMPMTESEQKAAERRALSVGSGGNGDDDQFKVKLIAPDCYPDSRFREFIDCLAQADRLREVRALRGFSRVLPVTSGDPYVMQCAPLSRQPTDWLPALEVNGEGIYFELSPYELSLWRARESVKQRHKRIEERWQASDFRDSDCPPAEFVLVHTLAHMLINQLSLECGYGSASLRERLYVKAGMDGWAGALIYTAVPGADGTLGGLVSQGTPGKFFATLERSVEESMWCSSDPLCIDLEGQGAEALNQAACHACCLVSETSCEQGNSLLDRAYICGTDDEKDLSFFDARSG